MVVPLTFEPIRSTIWNAAVQLLQQQCRLGGWHPWGSPQLGWGRVSTVQRFEKVEVGSPQLGWGRVTVQQFEKVELKTQGAGGRGGEAGEGPVPQRAGAGLQQFNGLKKFKTNSRSVEPRCRLSIPIARMRINMIYCVELLCALFLHYS